ncbi:MAG: biopolymer transporter Tol [Ignavibacteria bacterium]|jgi:Tol biopolymer transport system component|nr:biopolymer transporter Tol [Ignavibacteria bacterium]MCU7504132.1 biopolymer transporter Tol [Ignavibacteria bacterium]MCU7516418.1 biopolymer transporter Tol [Ignavibacteria bacterium]
MGKKILFLFVLLLSFKGIYGQDTQFGQNKVQYKNYSWYYIQTRHFDIYFSDGGGTLAEFTAKAAEDALVALQNSFRYAINNRITIIVYRSHNDFQETNVTDEYLEEGIGGFTEIFKNRVVLPFDGSYSNFRHVIHHELSHAVINDMFYGGSFQNIISKNINVQVPLWFNEGLAEYESLGWDTNTDMFIRDAIINEYLPDLNGLNGYFAYRGGQSAFYYISQKYGKEKISEIISKTRGSGDFEEALKSSIGLNYEELNDRWKKDLKKTYWPDIAKMDDPEAFAKKLTDQKKDKGGSYNVIPAISPQGDKIAFISNRDIYFDVYIMNAIDGKIIKKLIEGNRSSEFEELNILAPGLTWSPDGKKIILTAKSNGYDVAYLIDVDSEDKDILPIKLDGISSMKWSHDGKHLLYVGQNGTESDLYVYNMESKEITNITGDIFTDTDPVWSPDDKLVYFASDRGPYTNPSAVTDTFSLFHMNYHQTDLYALNPASRQIVRLTDLPKSDESSPVISPDGKHMLFVSNMNGINNIYEMDLNTSSPDSLQMLTASNLRPITNSLNGLSQLSLSQDGKKLVFSSFYDAAYNLFLMMNPFEPKTTKKQLEPTVYYAGLLNPAKADSISLAIHSTTVPASTTLLKDTTGVKTAGGKETDSVRSHIFTGNVEVNKDSTSGKDYSRYVFGGKALTSDTAGNKNPEFNLKNNLDKNGNFYVNKYKVSFSPDIVYANAGYSTLYGLLGTTVLSFSDVLGNHRLIGVTSMQIDLKNSDYGLAYYYLPKRVNYGIEAFHTARFVYLDRSSALDPYRSDLFRFRNYGTVLSASYPLNKFYRIDAGLSWLNVSAENLDNTDESPERISYIIPSLSFVHDNTMWGYTAPIDGTRYNLTLFGNPFSGSRNLSFYSFNWDFRHYSRFWFDNAFVFRLSGGYSGGENPQRFFIGGTDNWINRTFSTGEIPLRSASDFAFLTPALPLRGYNYAEKIGTKYSLLNLELRMPLIRYLVTGPVPLLFQNILGAAFVDAGTAWDKTDKLQLLARQDGSLKTKDLLMGTGVGARIFFLYFLVRFDVAWQYNLDHFSTPKYYFSLGADF